MDAHDSVREKVQAIFQEWAGERANLLRGDVPARDANTILGRAIARMLAGLRTRGILGLGADLLEANLTTA